MPFVLDSRLAADTHAVGDLPLSRLLLMEDARFPWLILVPRIAGARELIDLDEADRHTLLGELSDIGRALEALLRPDKLNIAALGNIVSQLHVHLIARYTQDAAWPRPVWGHAQAVAYADDAREHLLGRLREAWKPLFV
jgi:diadenosine tetraphosphate (Ap4A) HIT family hydrolase